VEGQICRDVFDLQKWAFCGLPHTTLGSIIPSRSALFCFFSPQAWTWLHRHARVYKDYFVWRSGVALSSSVQLDNNWMDILLLFTHEERLPLTWLVILDMY